ncbi:MAG: hypothetical protein ACXAEU_20715 [Candidatus Hodarchaeales archaeon]
MTFTSFKLLYMTYMSLMACPMAMNVLEPAEKPTFSFIGFCSVSSKVK